MKEIVASALFYLSTVIALNATGAAPRDEAADVSRSLLMVWHGPSEAGFLRAELWRRERAEFPAELVIASVGEGTRIVYVGSLISLPLQLKTDPASTRLFVRSPADIRTQHARETAIIASVSPTGILRVYGFGFRDFGMPCELKPASN